LDVDASPGLVLTPDAEPPADLPAVLFVFVRMHVAEVQQDGAVVQDDAIALCPTSAPAHVCHEFLRGLRDGGAPREFFAHLLVVVARESAWDPDADSQTGYRGLTQFSHATWDEVMLSSEFGPPISAPYIPAVYDPYLHGIAAARLLLTSLARNTPLTYAWSTW
jgi:hypothetical protein